CSGAVLDDHGGRIVARQPVGQQPGHGVDRAPGREPDDHANGLLQGLRLGAIRQCAQHGCADASGGHGQEMTARCHVVSLSYWYMKREYKQPGQAKNTDCRHFAAHATPALSFISGDTTQGRTMERSAAPSDITLLDDLEGRMPPRPAWFSRALDAAPERDRVEVGDITIEMLTWGEVGKPGLLFLHGNAAHADWWSFIAPYFAKHYRVAAFSWSGMGNSDWRDNYSIDDYVEEIEAAANTAGLFEAEQKPVVIAHSFGTFPALAYAATRGDKLAGLVSMDTPILSPADRERLGRQRRDAEDM